MRKRARRWRRKGGGGGGELKQRRGRMTRARTTREAGGGARRGRGGLGEDIMIVPRVNEPACFCWCCCCVLLFVAAACCCCCLLLQSLLFCVVVACCCGCRCCCCVCAVVVVVMWLSVCGSVHQVPLGPEEPALASDTFQRPTLRRQRVRQRVSRLHVRAQRADHGNRPATALRSAGGGRGVQNEPRWWLAGGGSRGRKACIALFSGYGHVERQQQRAHTKHVISTCFVCLRPGEINSSTARHNDKQQQQQEQREQRTR